MFSPAVTRRNISSMISSTSGGASVHPLAAAAMWYKAKTQSKICSRMSFASSFIIYFPSFISKIYHALNGNATKFGPEAARNAVKIAKQQAGRR